MAEIYELTSLTGEQKIKFGPLICVNCKWHFETVGYHKCGRPRFNLVSPDRFDSVSSTFCEHERDSFMSFRANNCGPEGNFYEEKDSIINNLKAVKSPMGSRLLIAAFCFGIAILCMIAGSWFGAAIWVGAAAIWIYVARMALERKH